MNTTGYNVDRTKMTAVAGLNILHFRSMLIAYPARGGTAKREVSPTLRPSFAIREIRDTRLLSVERSGGMANVAHAPNVRLLIYSKPCRGLCCADWNIPRHKFREYSQKSASPRDPESFYYQGIRGIDECLL